MIGRSLVLSGWEWIIGVSRTGDEGDMRTGIVVSFIIVPDGVGSSNVHIEFVFISGEESDVLVMALRSSETSMLGVDASNNDAFPEALIMSSINEDGSLWPLGAASTWASLDAEGGT